ncbi:unnamed protein product [Prorocentrum cordatum]|nr:unnamed protein product [Polarella glacialis]
MQAAALGDPRQAACSAGGAASFGAALAAAAAAWPETRSSGPADSTSSDDTAFVRAHAGSDSPHARWLLHEKWPALELKDLAEAERARRGSAAARRARQGSAAARRYSERNVRSCIMRERRFCVVTSSILLAWADRAGAGKEPCWSREAAEQGQEQPPSGGSARAAQAQRPPSAPSHHRLSCKLSL